MLSLRNFRRRLLAAGVIGLFGAATLRGGDAEDLARYDASISAAARKHWAFQPVPPVEVPTVADRAWVRTPIDAFVLSKLEARDWKPSPPAHPAELLRRVYLDVIGLPPTLDEQDAFLKEPSPEALDKVIDALLARPEYGERWARHWLDVARYADTNGYERDGDKPSAWRYRDYVIDALNKDKPYDRFVLEQLAGDELPDADVESVVATGFLRLGPWDDEPADPKTDEWDQLDDVVAATSQAFLGMTLQCARCHNHKFEPLTQHDYYRTAAVFRPLKRPRDSRDEIDAPAATAHARPALAERDRRTAGLRALQVGRAFSPLPGLSGAVEETEIRRLRTETPDPVRAYILVEPSPVSPETPLLFRGSPARAGPAVDPGVPAVLVEKQPAFLAADDNTTRRRLSLARWIASKDNPLTARVIVNRVWQHHFGEGLVRTPSDFGKMGEAPTHPELLDWLTDRFVHDGWSLKKLHRLILTSNAYRMSKRANADYAAKDPDDRLLWRVPFKRLDVEVIRDAALSASGRLNPKRGGPGMRPPIPPEALAGHSDPDKAWTPSDEREASRRSVYIHVKRSLLVPLIETLDGCDVNRSTAKRPITTVAPQALTLFNGDFVNGQAKYFAARLEKEAGDDPAAQVERAYRLALCRPPTEKEKATLTDFLNRGGKEGIRAAREQMCRVILNLNEFMYDD
jgi:hypothetical protein